MTLTSVINSGYGDPLYIYRKWNRWEIAVENSFEDGEVKVKGSLRNSGWTEPDLSFEEWVSLDAVEEGNSHGGYVQRFQDWKKDENPQSLAKTALVEIVDDYNESVTWTAVFKNEYNITFSNNFISVGNLGEIKINNTLYNQPASVFNVIQGENITAEALNQTYNNIIYSFSYWSDSLNNYTERTKTFYPSDHTTYTAYFVGKPTVVQNVQFDCDIGDPIKLVWNQHQNSSCNYRIYRKTRDQWGNTTGPDLLSTCSNGTTTYTDYDYIKASTYIDLVSYDVRAYYTIEGTEANTNWKPLFGMPGLKTDSLNLAENGIENNPVSFKLSNYPNPFNPTTSINIGLPGKQKVKLSIYTITGEKVAVLADRILARGTHQIVWDGRDQSGNQVSSGIYIYELVSANRRLTNKMLLTR